MLHILQVASSLVELQKNLALTSPRPHLRLMPELYRRPHHHERIQTVEHMKRAWEAEADAREAVQAFNTRLEQGKAIRAWPTITAVVTTKHP